MKVITNTACSVDGRIGTPAYDHVAIGSVLDRQHMSLLRARCDAVLVGGRTFRSWPLPLVPNADALAALVASGFPDVEHPPMIGRRWHNVVLTRTLDVPKTGRFYEDKRVIPLFFSEVPGKLPAEVVVGPVTVPRVLAALAARGVETLLIEAGGDVISQFLAAEAVDEMYVTVCPVVLGGKGAPSLADGAGFAFDQAPRLSLLHAHAMGNEVFCRYRVDR